MTMQQLNDQLEKDGVHPVTIALALEAYNKGYNQGYADRGDRRGLEIVK